MYKWIIGILFLSLLGGCANDVKKQAEIVEEPTPVKDVVKEEPEKEILEEDSKEKTNVDHTFDSEWADIENLLIPTTEEELMAQAGGFFTNDIPYTEETKQVWGQFGLGNYEDELTEKLAQVTGITEDPDVIFQALHYYVGSNAYHQAIQELNEFTVNWYEPYLPEPEEMEGEDHSVDPGKALILLDASSSMLLNVEGKQKMAVAKTAANRFATTIGTNHDISLIVYGHAGTQNDEDKQLSCTTIDEVYPLQTYESTKFAEAVDSVEAKGWTPIANAIKTAREKMAGTTENVTLYIISDGAETCDGDPVAEAKAFASEDGNRSVNIIGFDVDQAGENSLKEVAAAGNGEYISAKTIEDLNNSIKKTWVPSFLEVASKSNSLLKHWGQSFDEMTARAKLADRIHYAGLNEKSRFFSALNIMRGQKMITSEQYEQLKERIEKKNKLTLHVKKELDTKKREENEAERQQIIERVNKWSERMNKLRDANS